MSKSPVPSRGAVGGAGNEAGTEYRRGVAAYFVAHGLNGVPVQGLPIARGDALVEAVALETDFDVDDILVWSRGGRVFIQAKRDLQWRRIPEVSAQWIAAVRDPKFDPAKDLVVAVAGSLSESVRAAALALRRGREGATSYSAAEADAMARLREALTNGGASDLEIEQIIPRAVIMQLAVEDLGDSEATAGYLLLDGHVVAKGQGARAWRDLMSIAGDAARLRVGHSIETWLRHLRERGVPLVADANASRAGYLTARQTAVERYRAHLTQRGREVDLSSLGIAVPPIAFEDMDADVSFQRPGEDRDFLDPLWTFRRHGRVVVTGLPGSGKSTVVANLAGEWAARADWSLPILVPLRRLAEKERFRQQPMRDQIVEMAVAPLEPADRPLVADALHDAIRTGEAALFFDGLDEAADRSLLLVSDISALLGSVHQDTDALVATRDVAYADTQRLRFVDFRMGSPRDVSRVTAAVLGAIAAVREVENPDAWVAAREEWVSRVLDEDTGLRETPLFPVLLASLAADSNADTLPRTRTLILERVVQDVVRRRETTREIVLPGIDESSRAAVLLGAFPLIASTLVEEGGSAPRARLVELVAPFQRQQWGLSPGPASATAERVLLFWDEAGVFVASGAERVVSPRLQLLLEIGAALHAANLPDAEAVAWVRGAVGRPAAREALVLAAGKSSVVADALIDRACELSDRALVTAAAQAIGHGGVASDAAHRRLLQKLREHVALGTHEGWRAFLLISALTVPAELQEPILQDVDAHYPAPYPAIARAHACMSWAWQPERLDGYLEAVLLQERPSLPDRPKGGLRDILSSTTDDLEMRVLEAAATRLLPARPDLAPAAAKAVGRARARTADVIASALRENGHAELADAVREPWMESHRRLIAGARDTARQIDDLLMTVSSLAPAKVLGLTQRRRLAEFASFIQTLDLNSLDAWPRTPEAAASWPQFVEAVVSLGGFDARVLAAQAAILKDEIVTDPSGTNGAFWSLIDLQHAAPLTHWDRLPDPSAIRDLLLKVLRTGGDAARRVAAGALIYHPDRAGTAAAVGAILEGGPASASRFAVWAYLHLVDDVGAAAATLGASPRASVREGVARALRAVQGGRVSTLAQGLVADPVRQVRLGVLQHLEHSDDELRSARTLLEGVATSLDPDFTCHHCGTQNSSTADSCASCRIVTDRPSKLAKRLLERLEAMGGAEKAGPASKIR